MKTLRLHTSQTVADSNAGMKLKDTNNAPRAGGVRAPHLVHLLQAPNPLRHPAQSKEARSSLDLAVMPAAIVMQMTRTMSAVCHEPHA